MYRPNSSNHSFLINQPIPVGYSIPSVGPTDEELGIPPQRFQNNREMVKAFLIEIEKDGRRSLEIESEINRLERALTEESIAPPVPRLFVPPRDDGMSVEEKLARACEEKRLLDKAVAARHRRYNS